MPLHARVQDVVVPRLIAEILGMAKKALENPKRTSGNAKEFPEATASHSVLERA